MHQRKWTLSLSLSLSLFLSHDLSLSLSFSLLYNLLVQSRRCRTSHLLGLPGPLDLLGLIASELPSDLSLMSVATLLGIEAVRLADFSA